MIISKQKAEEVANKLTVKKLEELNIFREELRQFSYKAYMSEVPKEVRDTFFKHKEWFSCTTGTTVRVETLSHHGSHVSFSDSVPYSYDKVAFVGEVAKEYIEKKNKVDNAELELNKLFKDIANAILSLRTYKNVLATFPEAAAHIDITISANLPAIPIEKIRESLAA